jgi:hypothetical protein
MESETLRAKWNNRSIELLLSSISSHVSDVRSKKCAEMTQHAVTIAQHSDLILKAAGLLIKRRHQLKRTTTSAAPLQLFVQ